MATQHPELRSIILNHYAENTNSDIIERFIYSNIVYIPEYWVPYGFRNSSEGTLLDAFKKFIIQISEEEEEDYKKQNQYLELLNEAENILKYKLLPFIQLLFPQWKNIEERRRLFLGKKMIGLTNIALTLDTNKKSELDASNETTLKYFAECSQFSWWAHLADVSTDVSADVYADVSTDVSADVSTDVSTDVYADVSTDVSTDVYADVSTDVSTDAEMDIPKELLAQVQTGFSQEVVKKCGFLHSQTLCNKGWEGLSRLSAFSHWYSDKHYAKLPCDECRPECGMFNFKETLLNILSSTDVSTDVSADVSADVPADVSADVSTDIPADVSMDVSADVSPDVSTDVPERPSNDQSVDGR